MSWLSLVDGGRGSVGGLGSVLVEGKRQGFGPIISPQERSHVCRYVYIA